MRRFIPASRRAEDFAAALEGRQLSPAAERELADFVALVQQLREVETPTVRPDFAASLRERLMADAPLRLTAEARSRQAPALVPADVTPPSRRRALSAAAVACIMAGSSVGVAAASQSALPGEALYPVKRGMERLEVSIAGSERERGHELLEQASTRLSEVDDLTVVRSDSPTTPTLAGHALDDFSGQAQAGADALLAAYQHDRDAETIELLREFAEESATRLESIRTALPPENDDELTAAAQLLLTLDEVARQICPDCSTLPSLTVSPALLQVAASIPDTPSATDIRQSRQRAASPQRPAPADHRSARPHRASAPKPHLPVPAPAPAPAPALSTATPQLQAPQSTQPAPASAGTARQAPAPAPQAPAAPSPAIPDTDLQVRQDEAPVKVPDVNLDPITAAPEVLDGATEALPAVPEVPELP